jgi:hypothetical protein
LTARQQVFQRTPKRPPDATYWLEAAHPELIIGTLAVALGLALALTRGLAGWQAIGGQLSYAMLFLPAVWMARQSSMAGAASAPLKPESAAAPDAR